MPATAVTGMRSSLFLMGALLGRCGEFVMEYPGGCVIGKRPIDLHLRALMQMGAVFGEENGKIYAKAPCGLRGAVIILDFPSVGATENIILAAVTARGCTKICGAAKEPEVEHLCRYLNGCGAHIEGVGTSQLCIEGKDRLKGSCYTVVADRIVAGTYLLACVGCGGSVFLEDAPVGHMEAVIGLAGQLGAECQDTESGLYVQANGLCRNVPKLVTRPYPGFPTDLQSQALAVLTAARGECLIEETIFEDRFHIMAPLSAMGAKIGQIDARRVWVKGPVHLKGCSVEARELRGGASLVVAGLMAEGTTVIGGCRYIDRGYENICRDFRELGARIYSVS